MKALDTLITIAVIIYIIFSIKKALSSGKAKTGTTGKSSGWKQKIQDFVQEIQDEIEKANKEPQTSEKSATPGKESFWDDIIGDDDDADFSYDDEEAMEPATRATKRGYYADKTDRPPELPDLENDPDASHRNHPERLNLHLQPEVCRKTPVVSARHMSQDELKKAIIWSEILSKPLALRE